MHQLLRFCLLLLLVTLNGPSHADMEQGDRTQGDNSQDYYRYLYNSLLLSDSTEELRLAARAIGRAPMTDEVVLDAIAAALWRNRQNRHDKLSIDTLSWLAKDLGLSGKARYRAMLEQCQREFAQDKKLRNYVDEALTKLPAQLAENETAFEPEQYDVSAARLALQDLRAAYPVTGKSVLAIEPATDLTQALNVLGLPLAMDASIRRESAGHFASWEASYLRIWYPNFGGARFTYEKDDASGWKLLDHWPILTSYPIRYRGKDWGLAYALWTTDRVLLRETAQRLFRTRYSNTEELDVIADRLWLSMNMPDPSFSDAYAWLIRVLEQSQSNRYKPLLLTLIANSQDKKVVRFATDAIDSLQIEAPAHLRYETAQMLPAAP